MDIEKFRQSSKRKSDENKKFLKGIKKKNPRVVDAIFHQVHDEVFEEIHCLECANCCKTTSPIFYRTDIERAAKSLRMKAVDFIATYLRVDEDEDYVLKSAPCTFLDADNYCTIYEDRPKACREYPHTNRKKMVQLMDLTYRNTLICPAVFEIVERIKKNAI